ATNLSKFVGTFTPSSSGVNGTQDITSPGFQPKVVIFLSSGRNSPDTTHGVFGIGFSDGTNHRASNWGGNGGATTSTVITVTDDTKCIILLIDGAGNINARATCAMLSNGFRLTWTAAVSSGVVNYIALGGTDMANVSIGTNTMPTVTGNKAT